MYLDVRCITFVFCHFSLNLLLCVGFIVTWRCLNQYFVEPHHVFITINVCISASHSLVALLLFMYSQNMSRNEAKARECVAKQFRFLQRRIDFQCIFKVFIAIQATMSGRVNIQCLHQMTANFNIVPTFSKNCYVLLQSLCKHKEFIGYFLIEWSDRH